MADVKSYHLQVAPENTFESPILDKITDKNSLGAELPSGIYYLRVQGVYASGNKGGWSEPFKLIVTAPVEALKNMENVSSEDAGEPISVGWNEEGQATGYKVTVEKDGHNLYTEDTADTHFSLKPDGPGTYRIKVRSGFSGTYGPENVVRTIHVQAPPKTLSSGTQGTSQQLVAPAIFENRRKWFVDLGPVISNSFLGSNGTKYDINFGIIQPYREKLDIRFFYDGNFNTASQGSTAASEIGAGIDLFFADRLTPHCFFTSLDLGYGGGNRNYDAYFIFGAGVGWQFYRTNAVSFETQFHFSVLMSPSGSLTSNPSWQTLRIGARF